MHSLGCPNDVRSNCYRRMSSCAHLGSAITSVFRDWGHWSHRRPHDELGQSTPRCLKICAGYNLLCEYLFIKIVIKDEIIMCNIFPYSISIKIEL